MEMKRGVLRAFDSGTYTAPASRSPAASPSGSPACRSRETSLQATSSPAATLPSSSSRRRTRRTLCSRPSGHDRLYTASVNDTKRQMTVQSKPSSATKTRVRRRGSRQERVKDAATLIIRLHMEALRELEKH